jgi:hypothetical protein
MNNDVIELLKKALAPLQLHTAIVFGSYAD